MVTMQNRTELFFGQNLACAGLFGIICMTCYTSSYKIMHDVLYGPRETRPITHRLLALKSLIDEKLFTLSANQTVRCELCFRALK